MPHQAGETAAVADFDPEPYAFTGLGLHCAMKSLEAGSCVGTLLAAPLKAGVSSFRGAPMSRGQIVQFAAKSSLVGTALFSAACAAKIATVGREGAADRTYRLYHSESQWRTDKFAAAGAVGGGLAAAAAGSNVVAGVAFGVTAGILTHVSTSPFGGKSSS